MEDGRGGQTILFSPCGLDNSYTDLMVYLQIICKFNFINSGCMKTRFNALNQKNWGKGVHFFKTNFPFMSEKGWYFETP